MKIGIDAKWFFNGPPSGRVVIKNHIKHLIEINNSNEYYLFMDRRNKKDVFPYKGDNIHLIYIWSDINLISNALIVPFYGRKLKLDVIVFQNYPGNSKHYASISFIHDTLFLSHPQYYSYWERIYFAPLRLMARNATRICTVSNEEKNRLIKYGYKINSNDIKVIYHGVDEKYKPIECYSKDTLDRIRNKYNLPDKYLLFVGRLNIRKNIYHLIQSIPCIKDKNISLVVVGDKNWKMFDLDKLVRKIDIKERIIFTGSINDDDLACIYALAKIFCFPSYAEGFGLPPLEAMAAGIPVIVSKNTSMPEICGEAGNYVDPNSIDNITDMINNLLYDKILSNKKRKIGIQRSKEFTWRHSAETLLQLINEASSMNKNI
jgi:glycosyltransferase involved in cell wall biosynthesis